MKHTLIMIFLFPTAVLVGQTNVQTWLTGIVQLEAKQNQWTFDGGFRMNELKFDQARQAFARLVYVRKVKQFSFGGGYAFFDHKRTDWVKENRPFVQLGWMNTSTKHQIQVRFRHEFRAFENQFDQRSRLQLMYRHPFSDHVKVYIGQEIFYTYTHSPFWESRTQIGVGFQLPQDFQINLGYQYAYNTIVFDPVNMGMLTVIKKMKAKEKGSN